MAELGLLDGAVDGVFEGLLLCEIIAVGDMNELDGTGVEETTGVIEATGESETGTVGETDIEIIGEVDTIGDVETTGEVDTGMLGEIEPFVSDGNTLITGDPEGHGLTDSEGEVDRDGDGVGVTVFEDCWLTICNNCIMRFMKNWNSCCMKLLINPLLP